jgi:general secretion pathway protein G
MGVFSLANPRHAQSSYLERHSVPRPLTPGPERHAKGFTLIEIMMVVAILSTLSAIAIPAYSIYREKAMVARAVSEIKTLSQEIAGYSSNNEGGLPTSLNAIGRAGLLDPWGNLYQYLNYATVSGAGGGIRKDRNLHPLNSDYDLYSKGKDGLSQAQITAPFSQDDIIRANDGRFIGLAANY